MMNLGGAPSPQPPIPAVSGPGAGAPPQTPPGSPPGGMAGLMGNLAGQGPVGVGGMNSDPNAVLRSAMTGVEQLADAIKANPQMIEILAAVMKTHPTLRLVFLAASRHPEAKAEAAAGKASVGSSPPPILGR